MNDNEGEHDDWIDEFWALVQTALVWIGVSALGAWVMGVIYGLGTK